MSAREIDPGKGSAGTWVADLTPGNGPTDAEVVEAALSPIELQATDGSFGGGFSREHARRYMVTHGQDDGWEGPKPTLLLYTIGRTSGQLRRTPVLFFDVTSEAGTLGRHVIASRGGSRKDPGWYLNLVAHPEAHVRVFDRFFDVRATPLEGHEHTNVWSRLVEHYPMFTDYQLAAGRQIPVVRLLPEGDKW
jgi:deazaflavin-dependent oxidoreductase (nitroreductase family)